MGIGKILKIILSFVAVFFLYINLLLWHSSFWGAFFLLCFFALTNHGYTRVLVKFFGFKETLRTRIFGIFSNFIIMGFLWGALIVFYRLDEVTLLIPFFISGILSWVLDWLAALGAPMEVQPPALADAESPKNYLQVILFFAVIVVGFYFLTKTQATGGADSPWQIISGKYIYIFFISFLLLAKLIGDKFRSSLVLFLLVVLAFMMSSIQPMTSDYIYGADGWRHIASEAGIISEKSYEPEIFTERPPTWVQKINPGRFSYSQFWGVNVVLSQVLNKDLLTITRWLSPIMWSVLFVLLIYELGLSFGLKPDRAELLCLMALWPFALQAVGHFSLPANLGFLIFLFLLILLVKRSRAPGPGQIWYLAILGVLSVFGYFLYFVLFWLIWILLAWTRLWHNVKNTALRVAGLVVGFLATALFIPLLEIISGFSLWQISLSGIWSGVKQVIGNLTGYYLAFGPREHAINTGNIFFYQTPEYAFYDNFFIIWRWWIPLVMVMFFALAIWGIIRFLKNKNLICRWWAILSTGLFSGYVISRYFLPGENILARRMDAVLALLAVVIVFMAINKLLVKKSIGLVFVLIIAVMAGASYSLGPVSRAVSQDEVSAMSYVWEKTRFTHRPCVVADTYPLLLLEANSAKKIIGGGLPIDENFSQPERVSLYEGFLKNKDIYYFNKAADIAVAQSCMFVVKSDIIKDKADELTARGVKIESFGTMSVLEY